MLAMSDTQEFISISTFLADTADIKFCTNLIGASLHGGITCWPEATQYLLRTYAASSDMCEDLEDNRNVKKKADQNRRFLKETILRCSNVRLEEEKITLYIDGLFPTINMVIVHLYQIIHLRDLTL